MNSDSHLENLRRNVNEGTLSHAFIITGSTSETRNAFAEKAAVLLLGDDKLTETRVIGGNCADLLTVRPDGDNIKTEQINELSSALRNKPFSADRIVAIIFEADRMLPQSQNKLLKTLEEPAPGTVLMLLSENPERLLPTICSRCVVLRLYFTDIIKVADDECFADAKMAISIALQHTNPLADMFAICDKYSGAKKIAVSFLNTMEIFLRDLIVGIRDKGLIADDRNKTVVSKLNIATDRSFRNTIALIEDARRDIERGMNIKYCLKDMGVKIRQEGLYGQSG
jgi:DNA polymerase-3 subunit delta'